MGLLGRLPHDPAMLAAAPQFAAGLLGDLGAPDKLDRRGIRVPLAMDGNDRLSNCTSVGLANCARAAAELHGYDVDIPEASVIQFYSQSTGYDAAKPETDAGGNMALVLASQANKGFDIGAQAPLVAAWGTFDPADLNLMRVAIDRVGSAYLGVSLSISDQQLAVWDTAAPTWAGDPTPGSWGRHAVMAWDYTGTGPDDTVRLGTWGYWMLATWRWIAARADEAHAVAWRQFAGETAPVDYDALLADAALFAGWPGPAA
jgi:hypothetical protein